MISRNPFRIRATEYLEGEESFLSLYGLTALDVFTNRNIFSKIQIIRSARGGGKTSLLRIFSPKSLNKIKASHDTDQNMNALYKKLKSLEVFSDEQGIKVLGVYLSLFGNYTILSQLDFPEKQANKLFYSLLMCRIVIATLRSVCQLKELEFPTSLNLITIKHPLEPNIPNFIKLPCSGMDLYEWAAKTEQKILNIVEDDSPDDAQIGGHECLTLLHIIKGENILYNNEAVAETTLLMLDDVDKLTSKQRTSLSDTLTNLRIPIGIWLAERLEALRQEELLSTIGTLEREYDMPIILERFWRRNTSKFEMLLAEISDKRARWQPKYHIKSFKSNLQSTPDDRYDEIFNIAIKIESQKIAKKFAHNTRYRFWFDRCDNFEDSFSKIAEEWRKLEILIERDMRKKQQNIIEDDTLTNEDFESRTSTKETEVARHYIRKTYGVPYYFGFPYLVKLASSNIQQFLELSSILFDDMISSAVSSESESDILILAGRQEDILGKKVIQRWNEIERSISNPQHVVPFLQCVAKFCEEETTLPNSPYGGVTGIAISEKNLKLLQDPNYLKLHPKYKTLCDVLATCLAHNLLEPLPGSHQDIPGTTHFVLYLNRLLCFKFKLPISYGGWREQNLDRLCDFVKGIFKSKRMISLDPNQQKLAVEN